MDNQTDNQTNNQEIFAKHKKLLNDTICALSVSSQLIDTSKIEELQRSFNTSIEEIAKEGRNLNIAIMGQVKAGKSSFLNALLFNGKQVLPTAATPKTANLTRITYGETARLIIEFYNKEEWNQIEKTALNDIDTSEVRVAKELLKMVEDNKINPLEIIKNGSQIITSNKNDPEKASQEIMDKLEDYVGDNGKYTPLVKMTYLYLPIKELEGFNIIDTPGMNDPVISRGLKTQEEMSRTDVVFFLSHSSHFLGEQDKRLLSDQLPSKGVKNIIFVGGQFDSAILDAGRDYDSLDEALEDLLASLQDQAKEELSQAKKEKDTLNHLNITGPIFSSTYAHLFATLEQEEWRDYGSMAHVYHQLTEKIAKNFWDDYEWTKEDWLKVGNFAPLVTAYKKARGDKDEIIRARLQDALPNAIKQYQLALKELKKDAENSLQFLRHQKLEDIKRQREESKEKIENISKKLAAIIKERLEYVERRVSSAIEELDRNHQRAKNQSLTERRGSETRTRKESYDVEVSDSSWWNPFSWGSTKTVTRSRDVQYQHYYDYLNPLEAAGIVRDMASECKNSIEHYLNVDLIRADNLRDQLSSELASLLPMDNEDFDSANLNRIIEKQIKEIKMPQFSLSDNDYAAEIGSGFNSQVTSSSEKEQLKSRMRAALGKVYERLSRDVNSNMTEIKIQFEKLQTNIRPNLTKSLEEDLKKKENELKNARENIEKYEKVLALLDKYIKQTE